MRTLFISDVHLGSKHAQLAPLLRFLRSVRPDQLFIVGDFIDGWKLGRSFHWRSEYSDLLLLLSERLDDGMRVYYVSGNHDDFLRGHPMVHTLAERFGRIQVAEEFVFETADARRFLVTHGDRFDVVETSAQWLSRLIALPYDLALSLNWYWHRFRRHRDRSPYRVCARLKERVKRWIRFLSRFEDALMGHARHHGCDGVICGHLHTPSIVERNGMTYCNTGDWVENCTALLEHEDGSLELVFYYPPAEQMARETCEEVTVNALDEPGWLPMPARRRAPRHAIESLSEPVITAATS